MDAFFATFLWFVLAGVALALALTIFIFRRRRNLERGGRKGTAEDPLRAQDDNPHDNPPDDPAKPG